MKLHLVAASILAIMPLAGTTPDAFAQDVQQRYLSQERPEDRIHAPLKAEPQGRYLSQERPEDRIHAPLKAEPQGRYLSQERPEDRIHAPLKTEGNSQPSQ